MHDALTNLQWALVFSIGTTILNLIMICLNILSIRMNRKAMKLWQEATARVQPPA